MRCRACDSSLTESMARARMPVSGEYWELCKKCLDSVKSSQGYADDPDEVVSRIIPETDGPVR